MKWTKIEKLSDVDHLLEESSTEPQLIFKHSTRCSISSMALGRAEGNLPIQGLKAHYLDLIAFRELSNYIADETKIVHQSPQAILIINKQVVYNASHGSIDWKEIERLCKN